MTTATKILIVFLILSGAGSYFLVVELSDRVERQYLEAAEEPMVDTVNLFAGLLEEQLAGSETFDVEFLRAFFARAHGRRFEARVYDLLKTRVEMHLYVTDANGVVVFDSRGGAAEGESYRWKLDVGRSLLGEYGARSTRTIESDDGSSVLHVAAPLRRGDEIVGVVSLSKPQANMFPFMEETKRFILWAVVWSYAVISFSAVLFTHWLSSPIRQLTLHARSLAEGKRVAPPRLRGQEARLLGDAFESLRDALEGKQYAERYVQNLTHELKSPVAAIRGASELLQEEGMPEARRLRFLANIEGETRRLENIIDRLLALSMVESKKSLDSSRPFELCAMAEEVIRSHAAAAGGKSLRVETRFPGRIRVRGDEVLLEMALANLLQNAIEFSPCGGTIVVSVTPDGGGSDGRRARVFVAVEDEGPGIPDYARERVFERFYSLKRPDTGKKSTGLGLCFVKEVVELHGGQVELANRPEGGCRAGFWIGTDVV